MRAKQFTWVLAGIFLGSGFCHAAIFTVDGVIQSGYNENTEIKHAAHVTMIGGQSPGVVIRDYGALDFLGGTVFSMRLFDYGSATLSGGTLNGSLDLYNRAKLDIQNGILQGRILSFDATTVNINGGHVQQGVLNSMSYATINMYGGDTEWQTFGLSGYSVANIYGGTVRFIQLPYLRGYSTLNVFGGDITFDIPSHIYLSEWVKLNIYGGGSATWANGFGVTGNAEVNVYYTDILYYGRPGRPPSGIEGYRLADGSNFMLQDIPYYDIQKINFVLVPEPASISLLAMGTMLLRSKRKKGQGVLCREMTEA